MASSRIYHHKANEETDPLGDFTNVDSFNILQFLANDNDSLDSPVPPVPNSHAQMRPHPVQDPQHNGTNLLYQALQNDRQYGSPSTTDISGGGSSASPSSNSEAPYSPETYGNYSVLSGQGNNGLILGVQDLPGNMMMHPDARVMASPNNTCFMNLYPSGQPTPNSLQQVSPPQQQRLQPQPMRADQYAMNNGYGAGQMDLFQLIGSSEASLNSQCSSTEGAASRKRMRLDSQDKFVPQVPVPPMQPSPLINAPYNDENGYGHQSIKFTKFQEELWHPLYDEMENELNQLQVHVVADKGFNYSQSENCFVNQKKNHFQISVHLEAIDNNPPRYVKFEGMLYTVREFKLAFCGVRAEMPSSEIQIRQSQTDRKPVPHDPVSLKIEERKMTKVMVPRLHFNETTLNNQRKNNKPNPEQKYFLLVVRLLACTDDGRVHLVQAYQSERVIVRATNPGSFEPPESDIIWQRTNNALITNVPVVVGGDMPIKDCRLTVNGDIYSAGRLHHPSDGRLKEDIIEKEARVALENLRKLRVVEYFYKPEIAAKWGLTEDQRKRTGLIAQELNAVIPDAVRDIGDYLMVDENRVFYETVLATQELCRLTGDLDTKIDDKVEEISQRLTKYAARKKMLGSYASNLEGDSKSMLSYSRSSLSSYSPSMKKERKSSRHNNRCRSQCSRSNEPLCHSKITQFTIVLLVVVMAACLIAMSTLYVLDWYNRNNGYHIAPHVRPTESDGPGHMIAIGDSFWPMVQSNAPPIMSTCPSVGCHSYCCAERHHYMTDQHLDDTDVVVAMHEQPKNVVERSVDDHMPYKPFRTGVKIRIPSLNITIDNRYCVERSCSLKRGRYSLYIPVSPYFPTVPLDVKLYAPTGKTISSCGYLSEFDHKQCNVFSDPYAYEGAHNPTVNQMGLDLYELSVGSYLQSAYRFRVGYTTESCFSSEDHMIGGYEEYNLIFFRTCGATEEDPLLAESKTIDV